MLRGQIASFEVDEAALAARAERAVDRQGGAGASGVLVGDEVLRHRAEQAPLRDPDVGRRHRRAGMGGRALAEGGARPRAWLRTKANSIEGGTTEVMLGIVAKRILDLPGA